MERLKEEHQVGAMEPWRPEVNEMSPMKTFNASKNILECIARVTSDDCTVHAAVQHQHVSLDTLGNLFTVGSATYIYGVHLTVWRC